jgi:hypothetical protein
MVVVVRLVPAVGQASVFLKYEQLYPSYYPDGCTSPEFSGHTPAIR